MAHFAILTPSVREYNPIHTCIYICTFKKNSHPCPHVYISLLEYKHIISTLTTISEFYHSERYISMVLSFQVTRGPGFKLPNY